jgi:hypothetical protein
MGREGKQVVGALEWEKDGGRGMMGSEQDARARDVMTLFYITKIS